MKKILVIIITVILAFITSSCYDSTEVDDMVYIIAIGIDEASDNNYEFTFQAAVPLNISSGVETSFSSSEKSVSLNNINAFGTDLYSALATANKTISKELDISHCNFLVFSEKITNSTIEPHIKSVISNSDLRPLTYVAVARDSAKEYLNNISSPFELNPSRYYELFFNKNYSPESFVTHLRDFEKYPVVALPLIGENEISTTILKNFSKTSTLSNEETLFLNVLSGRFNSGYFSVSQNLPTLNLSVNKKPKITVNTKNEYPKISFKLDLYGTPLSVIENKDEFDKKMAEYIQKSCIDLLYKTSKEFKADVLNTSAYAKKNFLTLHDFEEYEWDKKYQQAEFDVIVNYKTIR